MRQFLSHPLRPVPLAALALLAGCGSSSTPQPSASPTAAVVSGDAAKVVALSPGLRAGVLLRAIRDAEQNCQRVVDQSRADAPGGPPTWIATCDDKRRWVVSVANDGTATVTAANDIARAAAR